MLTFVLTRDAPHGPFITPHEQELADCDPIWERLCWMHYKVLRTSCLAGSWREVFIEHTLLQAGRKENQALAREQRYLDCRSAAGLERVSRQSVEGI